MDTLLLLSAIRPPFLFFRAAVRSPDVRHENDAVPIISAMYPKRRWAGRNGFLPTEVCTIDAHDTSEPALDLTSKDLGGEGRERK